MQPRQVQFFVRHNFFWFLCRFGRLRQLFDSGFLRCIFHQNFFSIRYYYRNIGFSVIFQLHGFFKNVSRREGYRLFQAYLFLVIQRDFCSFILTGCVNTDTSFSLRQFQINGGVYCGIFYRTNSFIRHKILLKCLFFKGLQPCKIRLVIRIDTGHEFDIRSVLIRQIPVPCLAEITASPGPLFFTGRDMMVCNMQDTCF